MLAPPNEVTTTDKLPVAVNGALKEMDRELVPPPVIVGTDVIAVPPRVNETLLLANIESKPVPVIVRVVKLIA